jgi:hypothetical protein
MIFLLMLMRKRSLVRVKSPLTACKGYQELAAFLRGVAQKYCKHVKETLRAYLQGIK